MTRFAPLGLAALALIGCASLDYAPGDLPTCPASAFTACRIPPVGSTSPDLCQTPFGGVLECRTAMPTCSFLYQDGRVGLFKCPSSIDGHTH